MRSLVPYFGMKVGDVVYGEGINLMKRQTLQYALTHFPALRFF